jgi:hypothetical protein
MQVVDITTDKTYDLDQLEKAHGMVKAANGAIVYLTQDAYLDANPHNLSEAIYSARGIDSFLNEYRIAWEIIDTDTDDESNACDWDAPYLVECLGRVE